MKICVVAARSGSKGLPDKNIKSFMGKPLLSHTVEQAVNSRLFDVVLVSSDSQKYLEIGKSAGADLLLLRPDYLSTDTAGKPPVLKHAMLEAENILQKKVDIIVDLQPTSPLRRREDIEGAILTLQKNTALKNVVSVCVAKSSPYYTLVEENSDGTVSLSKPLGARFERRQDIPVCYDLNGSIYAWRRQPILEELPSLTDATGFWLMPDECNYDIDTEIDFEIAEFIAKKYYVIE